jgi:hypothetical protein
MTDSPTARRELFYCAAGLALFFASDAFLDNSLVEVPDGGLAEVPREVLVKWSNAAV